MMFMLRVMTYVDSDKLFGIVLVLCDFNLPMFELTKGLLFDIFFIVVFNNLCCCDH